MFFAVEVGIRFWGIWHGMLPQLRLMREFGQYRINYPTFYLCYYIVNIQEQLRGFKEGGDEENTLCNRSRLWSRHILKYVEADAGGKQKMVNTALKPGETELTGNCNEFTKMHTLFDIQLKLN